MSSAYLKGLDLHKEELDASIIGTIGDMDGPMSTDSKGWLSLRRYLMGHKDETRQRFRDEVSRAARRALPLMRLGDDAP